MKKFLLYLILVLYSSISNGQSNAADFSDMIVGPPNGLKSGIIYSSYIPNSTTPMKYIRVNFHFMQKSGGIGNFTETSDGVTTNSIYTGYSLSKKIIELANSRLMQNQKSNLPPGNTIPIIDPKYSFVLEGVYYHIDDANYKFGSSNAISLYSVNKENSINIFF